MIHLNFVIRQSDVSTLIGSQGSYIKQLEQDTSTTIKVQRDEGVLERDLSKLRRVKISGTKKNIVEALVEATKTITPETDAPFLQLHVMLGKEDTNMDSLSLGQKESLSKIDFLNSESSARLKVVTLGQWGTLGIEILTNSEEELQETLIRVLEMFENEGLLREVVTDRKAMLKLVKQSIDEQVKSITSKEAIAFLVPYDKASTLIGPKGSTIKELEKTHDVQLVVEKPESSYCTVGHTVVIRGTIEKMGECLADVTARIFESECIEPRVIILLPAGVPRYLIGHSGETIKRVEKESGCKLEIERTKTRRNGEIAGRQYDIEYCQITGSEDTIARGVQGVAAIILIQLDIQGLTSEATIPAGADFGSFFEKTLSGNSSGMSGRKAQRGRPKGFTDPHRRPSHGDRRRTRGLPRVTSRGLSSVQPRRSELRTSRYEDQCERREADEWLAGPRKIDHQSRRSHSSDWPSDSRNFRDRSLSKNTDLGWTAQIRNSRRLTPHESSPISGIDWGTGGSVKNGYGAVRPFREGQPSRGIWDNLDNTRNSDQERRGARFR